jgi:WD40 repeat protein
MRLTCTLAILFALLTVANPIRSQTTEVETKVIKVAGAVDSLDWSPIDDVIAVQTKPGEGAKDRIRAIELWDTAQLRRVKVITKTEEVLFSVRYAPDGGTLACVVWTEPNPLAALLDRAKGSKGSEVRRWNLKTGELATPSVGVEPSGIGVQCRSSFMCLAISPDGNRLAVGTKITDEQIIGGAHIGGEVCTWDAKNGKLLWSDHTTHTDIVYAA